MAHRRTCVVSAEAVAQTTTMEPHILMVTPALALLPTPRGSHRHMNIMFQISQHRSSAVLVEGGRAAQRQRPA
eukprot:133449-Pyramimonas_sp.AAC.1